MVEVRNENANFLKKHFLMLIIFITNNLTSSLRATRHKACVPSKLASWTIFSVYLYRLFVCLFVQCSITGPTLLQLTVIRFIDHSTSGSVEPRLRAPRFYCVDVLPPYPCQH